VSNVNTTGSYRFFFDPPEWFHGEKYYYVSIEIRGEEPYWSGLLARTLTLMVHDTKIQ